MRPFVAEFVSRHLSNVVVHSSVPSAASAPLISAPLIGTHDGSFHCDEAMACGLLKHTADFAAAHIVRTRDESQLAQCNIVVDVGGKYDPKSLRLDHHQREFQETMTTPVATYNTRMSSAGLVYKHFGREIIMNYATHAVKSGMLAAPPTEAELDIVYDRMYRNFVEQIDGIDNGVDEVVLTPEAVASGAKLQRNYRTTTSLSSRVGSLIPRWNDKQTKEAFNSAFSQAVQLTAGEFFDQVDYYLLSWIPARSVVHKAFRDSANVHSSRQILSLDGGIPWREHLLDIETEDNCVGRTLYVLIKDINRGWRVQAVPKDIGGTAFGDRKSLPWKGLRDEALSKASGVPGCIFVHVSGFIGGNETYEGALAMAVKALEMPEE